ncbi:MULTISPECIES: DUF411 domain-containing protein [Rhodopseudomonas]|uniref:DUF411 domain-containing protein n=1 Tax=Rhodopseudomonas palustris TaxID=1076 RepID=A0A0D7EEJ6_RHOPL|nr:MULTISPECIES: DUF411 domain-containing protein [Rhodopseudomonas]KIZ38945.1 hypothetical protein OO17_21935 [Rhodopseudomonas palustris]MDF3811820.1 DUF411 domain-containing protein [Rhodopseudomonas sp. BAL398]WOK20289.1 DUF411 domain-containing protein [Rhodopseudomonas sp. BAL398]
MKPISRRQFAIGAALLPLVSGTGLAQTALPKMTVSKDPSCGCCGAWVTYLQDDGFVVETIEAVDMERVKAALGVPQPLWSCHTAEIGGYVIEGHVPAPIIRRLLRERPAFTGLAVAGMPMSAPGMDVPGARDTYEVAAFKGATQQPYARFQGRREIAG